MNKSGNLIWNLIRYAAVALIFSLITVFLFACVYRSILMKLADKEVDESFLQSANYAACFSDYKTDSEILNITSPSDTGILFESERIKKDNHFKYAYSSLMYSYRDNVFVADSFGKCYIEFKHEGKWYNAACDKDEIEMQTLIAQYDQADKALNQYYRSIGLAFCYLIMDEIYFDEDNMTFIPIKAHIGSFDFNLGKQTETDIGTFDLTPTYNHNMKKICFTDTRDDNLEVSVKIHDDSEDLRQILAGENNRRTYRISTTKEESLTLKKYVRSYDIIRNDTVYTIILEIEVDILSAFYRRWFIAGCSIICLFSLAVLEIVGLMRFSRSMAKARLASYRRDLTNALAHDLRSPLTVIIGYAQNLKDAHDSDTQSRIIDGIISNSEYANSIISSFLDLSKAERIIPKPHDKADLVQLANTLFEKYKVAVAQNEINIVSTGQYELLCDLDSFTHAVENLVSNAVKYTSIKGKISIIGNKDYFAISNTIDDTTLDTSRLTEPFYKSDTARSGKSGSGLGLSIADKIISAHGYKLRFSVEGNIFTVTIKQ